MVEISYLTERPVVSLSEEMKARKSVLRGESLFLCKEPGLLANKIKVEFKTMNSGDVV